MKCRLCDDDAIGKMQLWCKKHCRGHSLQKMIIRHGEIDGSIKWENYCRKRREVNSFKFKHEKFGFTEEQFKAYNKSRAVTLNNLIAKYGETEGTKRFRAYCKKQETAGCKKEYFVEKCGEIEGTKIYASLNKSKSHTLSSYIDKYGENDGLIKYQKYCETKRVGFYSNISMELFLNLSQYFKTKSYFGPNEFGIMDQTNKTYYKYDFVLLNSKKIIEFNGECFHPKTENDINFKNPFSSISSKDAWTRDENKKRVCLEKGFEILYIWENEYKLNKEKTVEKCLRFLNA